MDQNQHRRVPDFSQFTKENNVVLVIKKCNFLIYDKIGRKLFEKFPDSELDYISNEFSFDILNSVISLNEKEQLINISSDKTTRIQFNPRTIGKFYSNFIKIFDTRIFNYSNLRYLFIYGINILIYTCRIQAESVSDLPKILVIEWKRICLAILKKKIINILA